MQVYHQMKTVPLVGCYSFVVQGFWEDQKLSMSLSTVEDECTEEIESMDIAQQF